ncbi:MAG: hypothetical protein K8R40_05015 [Anaerolineaceae bacterium]|nr:hypothetical protein [Anaerolineaceae bacterium]
MKFSKISLGWVFPIVSLIFGSTIAFRNQTAIINFFNIDDAFYYFQVAKNATIGLGLSFDGIARGNGYHPLWMLVCLPVFSLSKIDLWLPLRILVIIQSLFHAATGLIIYKLLSKYISHPISLLLETFWLFSKTIFLRSGSIGLETGINMFFISLFLYYLSDWDQKLISNHQKRYSYYLCLGLLASFTLMARLDNIFLLCFTGLWVGLKDSGIDRKLVLADLFIAGASVVFSYIIHLGLSNLYFKFIPNIKILVITSMIIFPSIHFLFGLYKTEKPSTNNYFQTILRHFLSLFSGFVVLFLSLYIIFPKGGYSRYSLIIQSLVFGAFSFILKTINFSSARSEERNNSPIPIQSSLFLTLKTVKWNDLLVQGISYFGPVFFSLFSFLLFNHFYFGTSMPISGKIKSWWGEYFTVYGHPARNFFEFFGLHEKGAWDLVANPFRQFSLWFSSMSRLSSQDIFIGLSISSLVIIIIITIFSSRFRQNIHLFMLAPVTVAILFHVGYYTMTGYVGYRSWYWTIEYLFLLLVMGLLLDSLLFKVQQLKVGKTIIVTVSGIFISLIFFNFINFNLQRFPFSPNEPTPYLTNMNNLTSCTEDGSLIGMTGGGMEAYFIINHTIINLDGLINGSEYYEHLINMTIDDYLEDINLDYVFGTEDMLLNSEPYMKPLSNRLVPLDSPDCNFKELMILYRFISD